MSEPLKSIHVRLSAEAYRVLCALADINDKDNAEMARLLLEQHMFGQVHTLMLTAKKFKDVGLRGISRDLEEAEGK